MTVLDPVEAVREKLIASALRRVGNPKVQYELYANGQIRGGIEYLDCSAFTRIVWSEATYSYGHATGLGPVDLPHNASRQAEILWKPAQHNDFVRNGDVLFFYTPITHCGIAWWKSDGLYVIQAANPFYDCNVIKIGSPGWPPYVGYGRPKGWLDSVRKKVGWKPPVKGAKK